MWTDSCVEVHLTDITLPVQQKLQEQLMSTHTCCPGWPDRYYCRLRLSWLGSAVNKSSIE